MKTFGLLSIGLSILGNAAMAAPIQLPREGLYYPNSAYCALLVTTDTNKLIVSATFTSNPNHTEVTNCDGSGDFQCKTMDDGVSTACDFINNTGSQVTPTSLLIHGANSFTYEEGSLIGRIDFHRVR